MGNETAAMADFAQSLWNNFIKQKCEEANTSAISFYRAKVIVNNGDGTLNIQRPFDNVITVNCTSGMRGLTENDEVVVARLGNSIASANHLVFAKANGDIYGTEILASGTYKCTSANAWEYTGVSFTTTSSGFIYLTSSVVAGSGVTGLGISSASSSDVPRVFCYEASDARRTPIFYVASGTYYIIERRNAASSSSNTFRAVRVWI